MDSFISPGTIIVLIVAAYCGFELVVTQRQVGKNLKHPLVSRASAWIPRFFLNLAFACSAARLLESGYQQFKERTYQLIRGDGSIIVLPASLLEELSTLPPTVASPNGALEHDLLGTYTGLNLILESRLHHSVVQRKLTPRLGSLAPHLQEELNAAVRDHFPLCDDWTELQPYQIFGQISARLSARALVGSTLCRDPTWLDISFNYTENLFRTIVVLRLFPNWTHPFLFRAIPSYWKCQAYLRSAKRLLSPRIQELLRMNDEGIRNSDAKTDEMNVLSWLIDTAKGRDRDPETLAHVEVLLALASVHTTLLRMVNVLYDLTANPSYLQDLEDEIQELSTRQRRWDLASYQALEKMDSVLRESQRMSPPTILGMKRLFKKAYRFSNGLHIPPGTYVCMPTYAIENDPQHTAEPGTFDGLRAYKLRQEAARNGKFLKAEDACYQFSTPEPTVLNFGYGKTACPGRHFASLVVKMLFVKLVSEFDFRFFEGAERPKNILAHEFLFCWPWQKMLVRRKSQANCPF